MKRNDLATTAVGVLLIAYALFSHWTGGIAGRSGSISVTRARDPWMFWISLTLFFFCGIFAVAYGLARGFNKAIWFTARVDALVDKVRWGGSGKN